MTLYTAGAAAVSKNALKVYGKNTEWLSHDIKAGDLFVSEGDVYEIKEVNSSTELTLESPYKGAGISNAAYKIVRISPQVIAADLASMLYSFLGSYNELARSYALAVKEFKGAAEVVKNSRFYIDTDGDLSQDDTEAQDHAGRDESIDSETASGYEVDDMLDRILGKN